MVVFGMFDSQRSAEERRPFAFLPTLVLLLLLAYTYLDIVVVPYIGFQITNQGLVQGVLTTHPEGEALQVGDEIVAIDGYAWSLHRADFRHTYFDDLEVGDRMMFEVLRDGRPMALAYAFPGFSEAELLHRLADFWFMGYIFWGIGTATLLLVRPLGRRAWLLIAFNYLTAIWFTTGLVSYAHMWEAAYVMRSALWLSAPVYLQLHWSFPRPLPGARGRGWALAYGLAGAAVIARWLDLLPRDAYVAPFGLAVVGSILLLLIHFFRSVEERRETGILLLAALASLAPALLLAGVTSDPNSTLSLFGLLISLPLLPLAYFYVLYRRQLGGLEIRANRLIANYVYVFVLLIAGLAASPLLAPQLGGADPLAILLLTLLAASTLTMLTLRPFQRFFERRILGLRLPPEEMLENYAGRIATSLTKNNLANIMRQQVLPGLFVRQAAMFHFEEGDERDLIFAAGLPMEKIAEMLGAVDGIKDLLEVGEAQAYGLLKDQQTWVRLSLPLQVDGKVIGLWLLGRKDPDDYYSQSEVNVLQALADQTAIALANIAQARRLRALYQADIDQQEIERSALARELHDDILHRLGQLATLGDERFYTPELDQQIQALNDALRRTVDGLRPPMLSTGGLAVGLEEFANQLAERPNAPHIQFDLPVVAHRYDPLLSQHIYRMVQEACENAIRHAQAKSLQITGRLQAEEIYLVIRDDGIGFASVDSSDLDTLLRAKHFGLAGMHERAALVNAELEINSVEGGGTEVSIHWRTG